MLNKAKRELLSKVTSYDSTFKTYAYKIYECFQIDEKIVKKQTVQELKETIKDELEYMKQKLIKRIDELKVDLDEPVVKQTNFKGCKKR